MKTSEARRAYARRYYQEHKQRHKETGRLWAAKNRDKMREYQRRKHAKLRDQVITAYGGQCACCGEAHREFLALDHMYGGGNKHRKEVGGDKAAVYREARDDGFPPRFTILCHNCNSAFGYYGYCPHHKTST